MSNLEQTLSIIKKPDAVESKLVRKIKTIFLSNDLLILKEKIQISKDEAVEFYKIHQSKPFFDKFSDYSSSGPIEVMVLEGNNAVFKNRELMGATNQKMQTKEP